jgi:GntR family transcriptional regulator
LSLIFYLWALNLKKDIMFIQNQENTDNSLPKYYTISREIIADIKSGKLEPGMRVPSENEIINRYEVSNTTARKILREIEIAGWASRIKGRGTFVREGKVERSANKILSFTKNMIEAGFAPSTKVLDGRLIETGYSAEIGGRRYTMKGPVYKIHRLRFADDIPMMMEVRYISLQLCPGIEKEDFTGSLYDIYKKKYGLDLAEINQMLSAVTMEAGVRSFFDLQEAVPAIRVEGVTFCGKEMILEMEDSLYRGDKYKFSVSATS